MNDNLKYIVKSQTVGELCKMDIRAVLLVGPEHSHCALQGCHSALCAELNTEYCVNGTPWRGAV